MKPSHKRHDCWLCVCVCVVAVVTSRFLWLWAVFIFKMKFAVISSKISCGISNYFQHSNVIQNKRYSPRFSRPRPKEFPPTEKPRKKFAIDNHVSGFCHCCKKNLGAITSSRIDIVAAFNVFSTNLYSLSSLIFI